jgi:hypothetical protein
MRIEINQIGNIESNYGSFNYPEDDLDDSLTSEDLTEIDRSDECRNCGNVGTPWCEICDAR